MDFKEVLRRRRMVREFAERPLEAGVAERIVSSAFRAPSAKFAQACDFLVLTEAADLERFWPFVPNQAEYKPRLTNAPLVVVPLVRKAAYFEVLEEAHWPAPYWFIDGGMATMTLLLSAIDEGLDAFLFWIMAAHRKDQRATAVPAHVQAFREEFGVPADVDPLGAVAIGYRVEDLPEQPAYIVDRRRDPAELVHRGQWGRHG